MMVVDSFSRNSSGYQRFAAGNEWQSTATITSILVGNSVGSFAAGSVFTLYGVQ
jgi:hypothetical protein